MADKERLSLKSFLEHARTKERQLLLREQRKAQLIRSAFVGVLAGGLAVLFQVAVANVEEFTQILVTHFKQFDFLGLPAILFYSVALATGAALLTARYAPEAAGSGIPHIKGVLLNLRQLRPVRLIFVKWFGGLIALAAGLSLGREGPTVQMGAAIGQATGQAAGASKRSLPTLISAGAGAGLAAAFNAPLAGFLFVMEEMKREMSTVTYGTAFLASVCSVAVSRLILGQHPALMSGNYPIIPLRLIPLLALLGVIAGFAGVLFNRTLLKGVSWVREKKVNFKWRGLAAGLLAGVALWTSRFIVGGGNDTIEEMLAGQDFGHLMLWAVAGILIFKFALTIVSYCSAVPGGIFAPILTMGALMGFIFGSLSTQILPGLPFSPQTAALVGMAALLSAIVRTPLTGVVLIVEMTADYNQLYALLVASFAAYLVAELMQDKPIYDALLDLDLHGKSLTSRDEEEPQMLDSLVEPSSLLDGRLIKDLGLPRGCLVVTIHRSGDHLVPTGATQIEAGDFITFVASENIAETTKTLYEASKAQ